MNGASTGAVPYLRRRTVGRAAESYRRWVGRAVGWWTILYLIFWLVVFVIAGVESLAPLPTFLPSPVAVLALLGAGVLVITLVGGRAPPVTLDRRDLYRLALGPPEPWSVLRWRYRVKQAGAAAGALVLGAVWSLLAPALFGFSAWYAAPALALLALVLLDLRWLRYVSHSHHGEHAARRQANRDSLLVGGVMAAALLLVALLSWGVSDPGWGTEFQPLAALTENSPWALLLPLVAFAYTQGAVFRSLRHEWPPRFGPQSLVLGQMQALRASQAMALMAGTAGGAGGGLRGGLAGLADGGERRRLLDALHDRPGTTRPKRSLPLPSPGAPQWRALAWRSASALYRRPLPRLGLTLLMALSAAVAVLAASGAWPAAPLADSGAAVQVPAGGLGGALGTLLAALFVARVVSGLLGPYFDIGVKPVDPLTRSFGRALPAMALMLVLLGPAVALIAALAPAGALLQQEARPSALIGAASLTLLIVLALEKYSSWSGADASRMEPQLVAAMLAALPALLLGALGAGDWTLITQFLLLGLVAIIPV